MIGLISGLCLLVIVVLFIWHRTSFMKMEIVADQKP